MMKKILLVFLGLCSFFGLQAQGTVKLRVMSMNIRLGGEKAGYKPDKFTALINEYQPDVVCLQEVDYKTFRNGGRDWLNEAALQTGMFPEFFQSFSQGSGGYGTAILSRYPFFKSYKSVFSTKNDGEREPRACGWICIQLPEGVSVRVMTVHLALQSATNTTQHINYLNKEFFGQDGATPGLMVGDFNAEAGSDPISFAKRKWEEMSPGLHLTIPSDKPAKQLDFVMAYPKGSWTCEKFEVLAHPELSDHCFIVADVTLKTE